MITPETETALSTSTDGPPEDHTPATAASASEQDEGSVQATDATHSADAAEEADDDGVVNGSDSADATGSDGEVSASEVAGAGEGAATGTPPKKKRRRKKKKPGVAAADGSPKSDRPAREGRERPAFNFGDVVFGKITEITDDVIWIDLAGKGRAIVDLRELDLPDEPAEPIEAAEPARAEDAAGASASEPAPEVGAPVESIQAIAPPSLQEQAAIDAATKQALDGEAAAAATGETEAATAEAPPEPTPAAEPPAPLPPVVLQVGAPFVGIIHNDGGRGGFVVLTRHPRRVMRSKLIVAGAFKEKGMVFGIVTGTIKGGIEVDVDGLRAFAPASHMDLRPGADLSGMVGKRLPFLVTQYGKRGRDVVLSRRSLLEKQARENRDVALTKLEVGSVVDGIVKSVVSFGAFIDVGGVEGLVPLMEMSHNRGESPSDVFKVGAAVQVKILRIDEKRKVWLSRKATVSDPWLEAIKRYAVGTKHTGKVVRLQPFGAFIELESGIDGLIHITDLSLKRIEHPSEVLKVGDPIEVVVAMVDGGSHRIGLHPVPTGTVAEEAPQRIQLHRPIKVAVVGAEANGLLVRVLGMTGRNARGFVPAMATGTARGTDLRKTFPVGTVLEGKVMEMDPRRGELKVSIKALEDETERTAYHQYRNQISKDAKFTLADLIAKKSQSTKS